MELVEVLKAMADETRLRILNLLFQETLCVCDLEAVLKLNQSNASRHLIKLKHSRLITSEKQAQWVYYSIDHSTLQNHAFIRTLLEQEVSKLPKSNKDRKRLIEYRERGGDCTHRVIFEGE